MRQSHLMLYNAVIIWITRMFQLVPQLIFVPYLIGTIGESGYGIYAMVWSLTMSIDHFEKSLQSGVVKYSAAFLAQGRTDDVNKVVSSSFVYSLLLAVIASAGTLVAAALYRGNASGQTGSALFLVGVMILFIIPPTPYIAVIKSLQRYYVDAIASTVSNYLSLLAVVLWFRMVGPSVEVLIIITAGMLFISRVAQVPIAYRMIAGLRNRPRLFDGGSFRLIFAFGSVTVMASLCLAVNSTGVRWLMGALASTSFVAHLAIMLMPGLLMNQIIGAMTITAMPATSAYEATGNDRMLKELLIRGMRYTLLLVLAGLVAEGLLIQDVLRLWLGPDYVFLAPYAVVLFATQAFMLSTSISHHILKGLGRLRLTMFISLIGLVVVPIPLILIVFQTWHNPYLAVIAGLGGGNVVYGCLQIVFGCNVLHAGLRGVFIRAYAQPLIVVSIVVTLIGCLTTYGGIESVLMRICLALLAILLHFAGMYFLFATGAERQQVKEMWHALLCRNPLGSITSALKGAG